MRNKLQNRSRIKSVIHATDILKAIGEGLEQVTTISSRVNLTKATTHRLLKTLESQRFVVQDPRSRHYHIGPLIARLVSSYTVMHQRLIACAFDEMRDLWELSGETVALNVRIGAQRLVLEELTSNHPIRFTLGKGLITPLHIGAGAKSLLSELPEGELETYLSGRRLVTLQTNEPIDKEKLMQEIREIKQRGYTTSFGETIKGGVGISVPIRNYESPASLVIAGPEDRFAPNMMNLLKDLKESAERISRKLLQ